jgi:thiol-disulfide isomerase/thioredoxin
VKDLVDDDIEAYVTDRDADVLVEFYAPWCGHCKKFAPFYHEVGQHFNADPSVKVSLFPFPYFYLHIMATIRRLTACFICTGGQTKRRRQQGSRGKVPSHRPSLAPALPARVQKKGLALQRHRTHSRECDFIRQVAAGVLGGSGGDGHARVGLRFVAGAFIWLFGYLVIWLFGYLVISVCVRAIRWV